MKRCTKCGIEQPFTNYHRSRNAYRAACKTCDKAIYAPVKQANRCTEEGRATRTVYRRARVISDAAHARELRHANKYRQKYPEKEKAKGAVSRALAAGSLVRPAECDVCHGNPGLGRDGRPLIQAHHEDYSKPLEVRWLCVSCHAAEHRSLSPGAAPLTKGAK